MQASDVADVILLNTLLALPGDTPTLIVRLINWKNNVDYDDTPEGTPVPVVVPDKPVAPPVKSSRAKSKAAATVADSDDPPFEPTPDPSSESTDSDF